MIYINVQKEMLIEIKKKFCGCLGLGKEMDLTFLAGYKDSFWSDETLSKIVVMYFINSLKIH